MSAMFIITIAGVAFTIFMVCMDEVFDDYEY